MLLASAVGAQTIQAMATLGLGAVGTLGAGAVGMARMACTVPFGRARSGQCCLLRGTPRGPRPPRSC